MSTIRYPLGAQTEEAQRRVGGSMVLMAGVAFWSFGTLVAPPAAHMSLAALCFSRVLVSAAHVWLVLAASVSLA